MVGCLGLWVWGWGMTANSEGIFAVWWKHQIVVKVAQNSVNILKQVNCMHLVDNHMVCELYLKCIWKNFLTEFIFLSGHTWSWFLIRDQTGARCSGNTGLSVKYSELHLNEAVKPQNPEAHWRSPKRWKKYWQ